MRKMLRMPQLLGMTPQAIHQALKDGRTDMDQVKKLPPPIFFQVFPNTEADQHGYLVHRPVFTVEDVQDQLREKFRQAELKEYQQR